METRNVSSAYLQPVLSRTGGYGASHTALATGGAYHDPLASSPSAISQNLSPKALTAMRTTRALKSLGQKVIFSNDPYVNSAVESLLTTRVQGLPPDIAPELAELIARKPPSGRLRPKGSKARALERAKRMIGASAAPSAEVPFYDSVRVCDLERDRQAMPALLKAYIFNKQRVPVTKLEEYCEVLGKLRPAPMLQAAALLMQAGYFFAAIKVRAVRGPRAAMGDGSARHPGVCRAGALTFQSGAALASVRRPLLLRRQLLQDRRTAAHRHLQYCHARTAVPRLPASWRLCPSRAPRRWCTVTLRRCRPHWGRWRRW